MAGQFSSPYFFFSFLYDRDVKRVLALRRGRRDFIDRDGEIIRFALRSTKKLRQTWTSRLNYRQ